MCIIGHLSTELISLIVRFVDQRDIYTCALLNKSFHATATPLLWRTLHDKNIGTFIKLVTDATSPRHGVGQHIRHANFNDMDNVTLLFMMQHVPHLETLAIDSARFITDTSLQRLPCHCPRLSSLHLRHTPITHLSLEALTLHCPRIWRLDLDKCTNLGLAVFPILSTMRCLKELYIEGGYSDLVSRRNSMNDRMIKNAAHHVIVLHGLTHLTLTGIPSSLTTHLLNSSTTTTTAWTDLTHLCLGSGYDLDETQVITFLKTHPHLVSLELHLADLSDATLEAIASFLPNIKQAGLVRWLRITPMGVRRLVCQCIRLIHVYFGDSSHDLSTAFPEATGYCFIDLRQRRKLFQLDLETIRAIRQRQDAGDVANNTG